MNQLLSLSRKLKFWGVSLVILAGVFAILSFSTLFWSYTTGTVFQANQLGVNGGRLNLAPQGKYGRFSGSFNWHTAQYDYEVDGKIYTNSLICICLPIGIEVEARKKSRVFYLSFLPSVSVLVRGPHFFLASIIALLGTGLFVMGKRVFDIGQA